ncbi:hypothetical protein GCM10027217_25830 [Pseudomaricurvus hydrocarbonicus]
MLKAGGCIIGLMALAAAPGVYADENLLNWSYIRAGGFVQKVDVVDIEASGFGIEWSHEFTSGFLMQISYLDGEVDEVFDMDVDDIDISQKSIFIGAVSAPSVKYRMLAGIGYDRETLDTPVGKVESGVYRLTTGGRVLVAPRFELNATGSLIWLEDASDTDDSSDFSLGVGARFHFTNHLSLGASFSRVFDLESDVIQASLSWQY